LIEALTGINADRLPEEKRRGMTVDVGFAWLEDSSEDGTLFRLGVMDVSGHERFVGNRLADAMAIAVAILVIAANASIQPQSRERLEILRHAKIQNGRDSPSRLPLSDASKRAISSKTRNGFANR